MSKIDDPTRLRHMRDAAKEALEMSQNETRASLDADRKLSLALTRLLEIIGEAASNVSAAKQAEIPQIEWAKMRGMRNRITHAYFEIDLDVVWDTVTRDLQPLVDELERVLCEMQ